MTIAARIEDLGKDNLSRRGYVFAWYRLTAKPLFELWLTIYPSYEEAVGHMIWFANIMTRDKAYSSRTKFESVRDEWLRTRSIGGRFLKLNPTPCYKCKGKGYSISITPAGTGRSKKTKLGKVACTACDNGVHGVKSIYLHKVPVGGVDMLIESPVKPGSVLDNLPEYEEFDVSSPSLLPMSALLRITSYYAVGELGMYFMKGQYRVKGVKNGS
jgi:hypothetical protein